MQELDEQRKAQERLTSCEDQISKLCIQHADLFVSVQRRSEHVLRALQDVLDKVDHAMPPPVITDDTHNTNANSNNNSLDMARELEVHGNDMNVLAENHKMRRRSLLQHSSLMELLEIPSLMDACVRFNLYDECLSLAALANSLERSQSGGGGGQSSGSSNFAVIESVVRDVRRREVDLRRHLISRLRGDGSLSSSSSEKQADHLSLPSCLEVVTALRRLNGIELERSLQNNNGVALSTEEIEKSHSIMELRLQIEFFEARDRWLENGVNMVTSGKVGGSFSATRSSTSVEHVLDLIEVYRTRCFEIATQYFAIFESSKSKSTDTSQESISLLSLWMTKRIAIFLDKLKKEFSAIHDIGALRDVLDACVFFASSLVRVGGNFQALLPPMFEIKIIEIVTGHWNRGLETLSSTLEVSREKGKVTALRNDTIGEYSNQLEEENDENILMAPRILLSYPPLGRLTNAYFSGLNELRRCLLPGVETLLKSSLDTFLTDIEKILQEFQRKVLTPGQKGEAEGLREIAALYRNEFDGVIKPLFKQGVDFALGYDIDRTMGKDDEGKSSEEVNDEAKSTKSEEIDEVELSSEKEIVEEVKDEGEVMKAEVKDEEELSSEKEVVEEVKDEGEVMKADAKNEKELSSEKDVDGEMKGEEEVMKTEVKDKEELSSEKEVVMEEKDEEESSSLGDKIDDDAED